MAVINSGIISIAQQTLSGIRNASSVQDAKLRKMQLIQMIAMADEDPDAQKDIYAYIASADGIIAQLEQESIDEAIRISAERFILDQDTRQLYDGLKNKGLWSDDELKYLDSIDEKAVYKVPVFDENGNPIKGQHQYVTGAEIKESATLLKAYENKGKLSREERKALNRKLHGHEHDAVSAEDIGKDMKKLNEAARRVTAHALTLTNSPEEHARLVGGLKGLLSDTTHVDGDATKRENLASNSPMKPAATAVLKNADEKLQADIGALLKEVSQTAIRSKEAPALTAATSVPEPVLPAPVASTPTKADITRQTKELMEQIKRVEAGEKPKLVPAAPIFGIPPVVTPQPVPLAAGAANPTITPPMLTANTKPAAMAEPIIAPAAPDDGTGLDFNALLNSVSAGGARAKDFVKSTVAPAANAIIAASEGVTAPVTPQVKPAPKSAPKDTSRDVPAETPVTIAMAPLPSEGNQAEKAPDAAERLKLPMASRIASSPQKSVISR